jgi:hypothetical protein
MLLTFKVEQQYAMEGQTDVRLVPVDGSGPAKVGSSIYLRLDDREQAKECEPGRHFTIDFQPTP